jgi:CheY-like chemotaxis protein
MPPVRDQIDLESLMREAISGVAVTAYAHGIGISAHIDNRLPSQFLGDAAALGGFLRRGLLRTVEAGHTGHIWLALWLDGSGSEGGEAELLLEVSRAAAEAEQPLAGLTDLWALPIGSDNMHPAIRQSDESEAVLMHLPCEAAANAPKISRRWDGRFRNRYVLHVGEVLFDRERFRASLAAAGLEVNFVASPATAMKQARSRADKGQAVDFLLIDCHKLDDSAIALAKDFRADPRLAEARIVLTGVSRELELPAETAALFDVVPRVSMPWRRLMDVLHDLARSGDLAPPQQSAGNAAASDIPSLSGRRILIAEDVATNQVLLGAVLAPTRAEVEIVADGGEVLERHSRQPADLILMDLQMPGMGGIAATRRLRALGGAAGAVPVVALTAYARSADRQRAMDAGMNAYLAKPIVVAELYDLLRRLLPGNGAGTG